MNPTLPSSPQSVVSFHPRDWRISRFETGALVALFVAAAVAPHVWGLAAVSSFLMDFRLACTLLILLGVALLGFLVVQGLLAEPHATTEESSWTSVWIPIRTVLWATIIMPVIDGASAMAHALVWVASLAA